MPRGNNGFRFDKIIWSLNPSWLDPTSSQLPRDVASPQEALPRPSRVVANIHSNTPAFDTVLSTSLPGVMICSGAFEGSLLEDFTRSL